MNGFSNHLRAARTELLSELELLDTAPARIAAMKSACLETGGYFLPSHRAGAPRKAGPTAAHFAEISALGIYESGDDEAEAVANWIKTVHRIEVDASCHEVAA